MTLTIFSRSTEIHAKATDILSLYTKFQTCWHYNSRDIVLKVFMPFLQSKINKIFTKCQCYTHDYEDLCHFCNISTFLNIMACTTLNFTGLFKFKCVKAIVCLGVPPLQGPPNHQQLFQIKFKKKYSTVIFMIDFMLR